MGKSSMPGSVKSGIPTLGKVPKGWRTVKFGDVLVERQRPVALKDDEEYQLVVAKRSRGGVVPRARLLGKQVLTKTQFEIHGNDFLISNRQIIHGGCGIVPKELGGSVVSNEYSVLTPTSDLDLSYLSYLSSSVHFQRTCFHSSVGVNIEKMIFSLRRWFQQKVQLPPLVEQKEIAKLLSTWDTAISNCETEIQLKEKRKRAVLEQLLHGQIRGPKFLTRGRINSDKVPNGWREAKLGELCTAILDGTHATPKYTQKGIPFYSVENVTNDEFEDTKFISMEEHALLSKRCKVERGDILLTRIGELGKSKLIDWDVNASIYVSLALLKVNPKLVRCEYVYSYLQSQTFLRELKKRALLKAAPQKINLGDIQNIPILLPTNENEQRYISDITILSVKEIALLKKQKVALIRQKRALGQELLSGQIRMRK